MWYEKHLEVSRRCGWMCKNYACPKWSKDGICHFLWMLLDLTAIPSKTEILRNEVVLCSHCLLTGSITLQESLEATGFEHSALVLSELYKQPHLPTRPSLCQGLVFMFGANVLSQEVVLPLILWFLANAVGRSRWVPELPWVTSRWTHLGWCFCRSTVF